LAFVALYSGSKHHEDTVRSLLPHGVPNTLDGSGTRALSSICWLMHLEDQSPAVKVVDWTFAPCGAVLALHRNWSAPRADSRYLLCERVCDCSCTVLVGDICLLRNSKAQQTQSARPYARMRAGCWVMHSSDELDKASGNQDLASRYESCVIANCCSIALGISQHNAEPPPSLNREMERCQNRTSIIR